MPGFIQLAALMVLMAQTPQFEVATVKPTGSPDGRALLQAVSGRLMMQNLALRRLESSHFDIQAKTGGNVSVRRMEGPMLQALLEERFSVKVHRETRQLPVYEMTVAKDGPKLQRAKEGECVTYAVDSPPPPAVPAEPRPHYCGAKLSVEGLNRVVDATGVTMGALVSNLSRTYNSVLGRNVIDKTGLAGTFDFQLKWANDPLVPNPSDPTGPTIFTSLQEQLGLRLEGARGPVEVLVIDHIEMPTAN